MDVQEFVQSEARIQLSESIPEGVPLCFVDSSFNPPSHAHSKLVQLCLEKFPDGVVALQLAIGNADKPTVPIQQLQTRADMMQLLAQSEFGEHRKVILGLTTAVQFAEKADLVHHTFRNRKVVFAMGFDTLLRVGDQRYYSESVETVIKRFFETAEVVVLTRNSENASKFPEGMVDAPLQAQVIKESPLFSKYMDKIHVFEAGPETDQVSSSQARSSFRQLQRCVPESLVKYIRSNNLYGDLSSE